MTGKQMTALLAAMAALCLLMLMAGMAGAQSACGQRAEIVRMLTGKYRESPRAVAIAGGGNLLEVYVSEAGSWTILVTLPQGAACITAAGQSWEDVPRLKGEPL